MNCDVLNENPNITVCIPTYNRPELMENVTNWSGTYLKRL